jgi:RND family efflux transporter MFP subunit
VNKILAMVISAQLVLVAGCSKPEPPAPPEVARPAKIFTVEGPDALLIRSFPGEVRASDVADLAFRVGGEIIELPASRGVEVKQGDLLAQLDPSDYQAALDQARAEYDLTVAQFKRSSELVGRQLISEADYDQRLAMMKVGKAHLVRAQHNLDYTHLFAPFDGVVARRLAENHESVTPGQVILIIQTIKMIDVLVDVPESIIARVERTRADRDPQPVQVRFGSDTNRTFEAHYKEHETEADPATLTYKVTFSMPVPDDLNVLPGMSAIVIADLSRLFRQEVANMTLVPIEAVFSAEEEPLDSEFKQVWVVNPETMRASRRNVKVGQLTGNKISISEGLEEGEMIISAGVNAVEEGMWVRPMERERGL